LQKRRKDKVGSICNDYADLKSMKKVGEGGFGVVYLYTSPSGEKFAVKKEKNVLSVYRNVYIYHYW